MKQLTLLPLLLYLLLPTPTHNQCLQTYQYPSPQPPPCQPCPTPCLTCFDRQTCTACIEQYYLDSSTNQCKPCTFGCAVCTDSTGCTTCIDGLYIDREGSCLPCQVGVGSCTIANVDSCRDGYFMLGGICIGCLSDCRVCGDFVTCGLCESGYYVGVNSTSCESCSANCDVCIDGSTCTSCRQGYILNGGSCAVPNCLTISKFCVKCSNGICQECTFGKYVNQNGTCSQGASLLCFSATGPYNTNCQTNLHKCPQYANLQYDILTGQQLPICLPKHSSQNHQYQYLQPDQTCPSTPCSQSSTQSLTLTFQKSYYKLQYHISLRMYSNSRHTLTVNYLDPLTIAGGAPTVLQFEVHDVDITDQLALGNVDASCQNCGYGYTVVQGSLEYFGGEMDTVIEVRSENGLVVVNQMLIKASICKVDRCIACTTATDCIKCKSPYYLQLISCIQQCDPGFYKYKQSCVLACPSQSYPIRSLYECSPCLSPCQTCISESACQSCITGYFLDGSACLTNCSKSSMFTNLTSGVCEPCPNPCTQCQVTGSLGSWVVSCSGCGIGYLLQGGNCTYVCPVGTFSNYLDNKTQCTSCSVGCTQCMLSANICSSCAVNYLLQATTCSITSSCPQGYYIDTTKNSCNKCHFPCFTCNLIATNCTSCQKGALYNNTCPLVCPSAMFISYNLSSLICKSCVSPCIQCLNQIQCLSCINTTYLHNKTCLSQCPPTYHQFQANNSCVPCTPPCLTCESPTFCLSCTTGYIDLSTHTCTLQCNQTSYPDANFTCRLCAAPCIRCYSATSCGMCMLPYVLNLGACVTKAECEGMKKYVRYYLNYSDVALGIQSGVCLDCTYPCSSCVNSSVVCSSCVTGYLFVTDLKICVQECPQSYYKNTSELTCLKCNPSCLTCQNNSTYCTKCGTSMYWYNYTCLLSCPSHYYGSNEQQTCKPCQNPCLDCYNAYLCKSCTIGIFYNKACVSICPSGSIQNSITNVCDSCTNNCLTCSISPSNCTECPTNGFYFYQNQCLTTCPVYFYPDDLSHMCLACIQPCYQCYSSTSCKSCINDYYYIQESNRCSTVCKDGYYQDNSTRKCLQCNITICRTCQQSANNCTECSIGYFYSYSTNTCTQTCPLSTYPDPYYLQCRQCQYPCQLCTAIACFSCSNSYKLFEGNCYSSCPIGYYAFVDVNSGESCRLCGGNCEVCGDGGVCRKCVGGYYVNVDSLCVSECGIGYYKGFDPINGFDICAQCPLGCSACIQYYNCIVCSQNYTLFNGLCLTQCPSLYFLSTNSTSNSSICKPCPQYCNQCTNETVCLQCVNSYIYQNQCHVTCPKKTYSFNEQICKDCVSPCLQCSSEYFCLTCIKGYFYFQNYCVMTCPDDVWKYPENNSCAGECPYNKYQKQMKCYVNGCGGMLVHLKGYCLDQCPQNHYVDQSQNCIPCTTSPQSTTLCRKPFTSSLQLLRSYNLKACIYFTQMIQNQHVDTTLIRVTFTDKTTRQVIEYKALKIEVGDCWIVIQFGWMAMELYMLEIVMPYVVSRDSRRSVLRNFFRVDVNSYDDYQYEQLVLTRGSRLLQQSPIYDPTSHNQLYKPSSIANIVALVLIIAVFVCMVINIICKATHYRQLLDFLQFVSATLYLQIQYPPILHQFLNTLRLSLLSFLPPNPTNPKPYTASPSKYIELNKDTSLLRSQFALVIFFFLTLVCFVAAIVVSRKWPQLKRLGKAVKRIRYRNVTDLFWVVCMPMLMFCFWGVVGGKVGDLVVSAVVIGLMVGFLGMISYMIITAKSLEQISGIAGQLQQTTNILGHMYTPFTFLRKLIFCLTLSIQPTKPISTLTLLLIFTVLIMVCLYFYQPFENQITDYVCIGLEVVLILYVGIVIVFGLDLCAGAVGHWVGVVGVVGVAGAGGIGLGWLGWLSWLGVGKFRRELVEDKDEDKANVQQTEQNPNTNMVKSQVNPYSAYQVSCKDNIDNSKDGQRKIDNHEQQNSAAQLIKITSRNNQRNQQQTPQHQNHSPSKHKPRTSQFKDLNSNENHPQISENQSNSEQNKQEFRHWNNDDSECDDPREGERGGKVVAPPKYLMKMDRGGGKND